MSLSAIPDKERVSDIWKKVKDRSIPVKVLTPLEYSVLDSTQRMSDVLYIVYTDGSYWFSPHMTSNTTPNVFSCVASSTASTHENSGIWEAFDGNPDTFWANNPNDSYVWLRFDFDKPTKIDGIRFYPRPNIPEQLPSSGSIAGSEEGLMWEGLKEFSNVVNSEGVPTEHMFEAAEYQYYMIDSMLGTYADGPKHIGIRDIEFHIVSDSVAPVLKYKNYTLSYPSSLGSAEDIYSTEETRIGTWIDGKPLYRRSFAVKSPSSSSTASSEVAHVDIPVDVMVNIYGSAQTKIGQFCPLPYYVSSDDYFYIAYNPMSHLTYPNSLRASCGSNNTNTPLFIILEYTKTTD